MAKAKKDQEQQVETKLVDSSTGDVVAAITEIEPAAFPESSVDSAFAAREAEAPLVGQELVNVEPVAADSDVLNVTKASLDGPVPAAADARNVTLASVEKVIGSEVHGTEAETDTVEAVVAYVKSQLPTSEDLQDEQDELMINGDLPSEPAPSKAPWKETHRVVTPDSVYLVMVVRDADPDIEISHAWTHVEYDNDAVTPALMRVEGTWFLHDKLFTGNVHSLAPAAEDRHTHRRGE